MNLYERTLQTTQNMNLFTSFDRYFNTDLLGGHDSFKLIKSCVKK